MCKEAGVKPVKLYKSVARHLASHKPPISREDYLCRFPGARLVDEDYSRRVAKQTTRQWAMDREKLTAAIRAGQQNSSKFHEMVDKTLRGQSREMRSANAKKAGSRADVKKARSEKLQRQRADPSWEATIEPKRKEAARKAIQANIERLRPLLSACGKRGGKVSWSNMDPEKIEARRERCREILVERRNSGDLTYVYGRTVDPSTTVYVGPKGRIQMKSGKYGEVALAEQMDAACIDWVYHPRVFDYEFEGKRRRYHVDFFLPQFGTYVELHPKLDHAGLNDNELKMQAKLESVRQVGCKIVRVFRPSLDDLMTTLGAINHTSLVLE
jgi:hypothetical protein